MKDTSFVVSNLATASYTTLTWNFLRISRKNRVLSDKNIFLNNTPPPRKEEINWVAFFLPVGTEPSRSLRESPGQLRQQRNLVSSGSRWSTGSTKHSSASLRQRSSFLFDYRAAFTHGLPFSKNFTTGTSTPHYVSFFFLLQYPSTFKFTYKVTAGLSNQIILHCFLVL